MKKIVFAVSALFATMGAAQAQHAIAPHAAPLRFVAGMGLSVGGDGLATAQYSNGTSQDIKAGGGVYFTAGADYRVSPEFSIQGTANFHVDDTTASNGGIKFQRFPIEVLGYYHVNNQWRVGGGVRYISAPKLSGSGFGDGLDAEFDNTTSGVVEAEYFWSPNFGMKMRYVNETFKSRYYYDLKANHFGISANIYF
jgi:opacity protein-like surface antigen